MKSWLAPFVAVAVIAALYWFAKEKSRPAIHANPNFFMIAVIISALVSAWASWSYDKSWRDYFAWIVALAVAAVCSFKILTYTPGSDNTEQGPL